MISVRNGLRLRRDIFMATESSALHIPSSLMAQVEEAARAVNQTPDEWAAEAMQRQLQQDQRTRFHERLRDHARTHGFTLDDVEREIAEHRRDKEQPKR